MTHPNDADTRDLEQRWKGVLGRLRLELSAANFATWLEGTRPLRIEGGTLIVQATRSLGFEWLNDRLHRVVRNAMGQCFPDDVDVHFVPARTIVLPPEPGISVITGESQVPAAPPARTFRLVGTIHSGYTFDRYLPASGNRVALSVCQGLTSDDGTRVSPVVVHGEPGAGKTHLLHALAASAVERGWSVACLGAEDFVNRYVSAIRGKDADAFQCAFRSLDLLIVDDLQYLSGSTKKGTQGELVHTIDAVTARGGVVAVASERHPRELELEERLVSRLTGGVVISIERFQAVERRALVECVMRESRVALPSWCVERLAGIAGPVRELRGAIQSAIVLQRAERLDERAFDATCAAHMVRDRAAAGGITEAALLDAVARAFATQVGDLTGPSKSPALTPAKAVAAALLRERGHSLAKVGTMLNKDKSTVRDLAARGAKLLDADPGLRARVAG